MTIENDSILRVVATLSIGSVSKAQNVFHVTLTTGGPEDDSQVVTDVLEWIEDIYGEVESNIKDDVELDKIEVYERVSGAWEPVGALPGAWAGVAVVDRMPSGCAQLLYGYKSRTGHTDKKYIPGMHDDCADGDEIVTVSKTRGDAAALQWITQHVAVSGNLYTPIHFNPAAEYAVAYVASGSSERVAYQRRRKPGVGLT